MSNPKDNLKIFEAKQRGEEMPEFNLPPVISVCNGPAGSKVCPFMPAQIVVMPVNAPKTSLVAGQQPQSAYVRQLVPCIKDKCAAWDIADGLTEAENKGFCRLIK